MSVDAINHCASCNKVSKLKSADIINNNNGNMRAMWEELKKWFQISIILSLSFMYIVSSSAICLSMTHDYNLMDYDELRSDVCNYLLYTIFLPWQCVNIENVNLLLFDHEEVIKVLKEVILGCFCLFAKNIVEGLN